MELSRLLFDDVPDLQFANFLHMITIMVGAGSTQGQTEFFILNNQKVPKLPEGEPIWSLSSLSVKENDESDIAIVVSGTIDESNVLKSNRKHFRNSNWPPVDWRTAPGLDFARANDLNTEACEGIQIVDFEDTEDINIQRSANWPPADWKNVSSLDCAHTNNSRTLACVSILVAGTGDAKPTDMQMHLFTPVNMRCNWTVQDGLSSASSVTHLQGTEVSEDQTDHASNLVASGLNTVCDSVDPVTASEAQISLHLIIEWVIKYLGVVLVYRPRLLGELVAFKYFRGKVGERTSVKWVNEASETGLPYDIIVGNEEEMEYIEVKSTKSRSATRHLSFIFVREWQFGLEKGDSFSIAYVVFLDDNTARVTVYKNPVKLCQLGKLRLAEILPRQIELDPRQIELGNSS